MAYTMTKDFHRTPYPAISPTRPELSQAGKTVLITGGSEGIGYAIAKAFIQASAAKVIILGRRQTIVDQAVSSLGKEGKAQVIGRACDMADAVQSEKLWASLRGEGIVVDVLILNAAVVSAPEHLLQAGTEKVWKAFEMNVRAQMDFTEKFYKQEGSGAPSAKVATSLNSQVPCPRPVLTNWLEVSCPCIDARHPRLESGWRQACVWVDQKLRGAAPTADCAGHSTRGDADHQLQPRTCVHTGSWESWVHGKDTGLEPP